MAIQIYPQKLILQRQDARLSKFWNQAESFRFFTLLFQAWHLALARSNFLVHFYIKWQRSLANYINQPSNPIASFEWITIHFCTKEKRIWKIEIEIELKNSIEYCTRLLVFVLFFSFMSSLHITCVCNDVCKKLPQLSKTFSNSPIMFEQLLIENANPEIIKVKIHLLWN